MYRRTLREKNSCVLVVGFYSEADVGQGLRKRLVNKHVKFRGGQLLEGKSNKISLNVDSSPLPSERQEFAGEHESTA